MNPVSSSLSGPLIVVALLACAARATGQEQAADPSVGRSFLVQIKSGTDESGKPKALSKDAVGQVISVLERRLDGAAQFAYSGNDKINIQVPGVPREGWEDVREKILRPGNLEFRLVDPRTATLETTPGYIRLPMTAESFGGQEKDLLVKDHADLQGKYVKQAFATVDPNKGWLIILKFDAEGAKLFGDLTGAHKGQRLAIVVDNEIVTAPNLNEAIRGGSAEISGRFTEKSARFLASTLENPLENPLIILREAPASAEMGMPGSSKRMLAILALIAVSLAVYLVSRKRNRPVSARGEGSIH